MSKKYHITESQMKRIVSHIKDGDTNVVEEGVKSWVIIGLLTLAGLANGSVNAQEVDSNSLSTAKKVQKYFGDQGVILNKKNLGGIINLDDAKEFTTKYIGTAEVKMDDGWAVTDIIITRDTILPEGSIITTSFTDTIDFGYSTDNMFETGGSQLTNQSLNEISEILDKIKSMNGKIVGVEIESSTDTEPISGGRSYSNNSELAKLRSNSVGGVLTSMGVDSSIIKTSELPNNSESGTMSDEDANTHWDSLLNQIGRSGAREKQSEYRYVIGRLIVEVVNDTTITGKTPTMAQIVEEIRFILKKDKDYSGGYKFKGKTPKTKKLKCRKVKLKGKGQPCFFKN